MKFEGLETGSLIRAYDFKPMGDRPDMFVTGFIRGVKIMAEGYRAYQVEVLFDSMFTDEPRPEVFVPLETSMDYDGRIEVLGA